MIASIEAWILFVLSFPGARCLLHAQEEMIDLVLRIKPLGEDHDG